MLFHCAMNAVLQPRPDLRSYPYFKFKTLIACFNCSLEVGGYQSIPSNSAKEIATTADSPVAERRKEMKPSSAIQRDRPNEETCRSGREEKAHFCEWVETSSELKKDKLNNTRYFVIKSLNHQNIQLSIKKEIWATQVMNEPILEEAFQTSGKVILIFSVNMSGFFQGYAQMTSSVGWRRDNVWSQGGGKSNSWGRSFKVKWLCFHDLPFQKTLHLKNPWNDFKPVKISRDCQELPADIGEALCELLDQAGDGNTNLKRDDFSTRRPFTEPLHTLNDDDPIIPPIPTVSMLYTSLLYQQEAEASRFQSPHQIARALLNSTCSAPGVSKLKQSRYSQINERSYHGIDDSSRNNSWGLSTDRNPSNVTFTEDDILEMTYEEYLEAHNQGTRRFHPSAAEQISSLQKSSSIKEHSQDSQSGSSSKKRKERRTLN